MVIHTFFTIMSEFRELTRKKQQLDDAAVKDILINEKRGVISVIGDNGYPYGIPMNHYYNEEGGKLYFHSGKKGHKIDALRRSNKVSYCVYDKGVQNEGDWALTIRSVVVFGTVEFIEDTNVIYDVSAKLSRKFTSDEGYIEREIASSGASTLMFAIKPEHIVGKVVKEA